jgi:hypothetical protein
MNVAKRFRGMLSSATSTPARFSWRPVVGFVALAALLVWRRGSEVNVAAASASAALTEALAHDGLVADPSDVTWVDGAAGISGAIRGGARALVRARTHAEDPNDLYLSYVRLSPEGALLDVEATHNLTHTDAADESRATVRGDLVAYTTAADGLVTGVHTIDLGGRASDTLTDFTRLQRLQATITNLQQTGRARGVVHDAFGLEPPATNVSLAWASDGTLVVDADGHAITLDPVQGDATAGGDYVHATPDEKAAPGNVVTWAVDRVRDIPWFGEERMQWVKAIVFIGLDLVRARFATDATAETVHDELGNLNSGSGPSTPTFTDPEIGWPPPSIKPLVDKPLPGEGEWIALDKDPFVSQMPGAPAAFLTTFIRPNPKRLDLRVYVTLWDARQIALHMESGTVEPVSATGERGPGLIPRDPEVMRHVVAAFNGGFQAQHGEYGMQANHVLYLPPKPYAATVMEMEDGSTAFGTWPPPTAGSAAGSIPPGVMSLRQNLTALVEFDKFNPWSRTWWGGTPPGWGDNVHTARTAVCLTKENFVGYFWSAIISAEDLGSALLAAGCQYAIHLDMNPGHAGFEFYDVQPDDEFTPLKRPLQTDWEREGKVGQMPGWSFRARRMIRGMGHMNFPRYIQREGRDFFYLTMRNVLPGAPLTTPQPTKDPGEGDWRMKGLPQHGFPYALAITSIRPDRSRPDVRVRVLRVDPRVVKPAGSIAASTDAPTVLAFVGAAQPTTGEPALWYGAGGFSIGTQPLAKGATPVVAGLAPSSPAAASATAVAGIQDADGMLVWLELAPGVNADAMSVAAMLALLDQMGCHTHMVVALGDRALLGGALDLAADPVAGPPATSTRLVRCEAPGAELVFPDTKLEPYSVWQPLQAMKIKVQAAKPSASGATTATPHGAPPPAPSGH